MRLLPEVVWVVNLLVVAENARGPTVVEERGGIDEGGGGGREREGRRGEERQNEGEN